MSGLLLPKHTVAGLRAEEAKKRKEAKEAATADSIQKGRFNLMESDEFATPKVVNAQLSQLKDWIDARRKENPEYALPKPLGWKMMVLMLTIPEETDGGLVIVDEHREARSVASPQGIVLAMGSRCYTDTDRFGQNLERWVSAGDRIGYTKYDAGLFRLGNGQIVGFLTDTQPVSLLDGGWEVPS